MEVEKALKNKIPCTRYEYAQLRTLPVSLQNISGFPTIQMIQNNKVIAEYYGDRSFASIITFAKANYVTEKPKPAAKPAKAKPAAKPAKAKPT
jgi:hypothetical protein